MFGNDKTGFNSLNDAQDSTSGGVGMPTHDIPPSPLPKELEDKDGANSISLPKADSGNVLDQANQSTNSDSQNVREPVFGEEPPITSLTYDNLEFRKGPFDEPAKIKQDNQDGFGNFNFNLSDSNAPFTSISRDTLSGFFEKIEKDLSTLSTNIQNQTSQLEKIAGLLEEILNKVIEKKSSSQNSEKGGSFNTSSPKLNSEDLLAGYKIGSSSK